LFDRARSSLMQTRPGTLEPRPLLRWLGTVAAVLR